MKSLSFDDALHEYRLTDDIGNVEIIPSVSSIVAAVTGKDLSAIPDDALEAARERGNLIHKDIETGALQTPEGKWAERFITDRPGTSFEQPDWTEIGGLNYAGRADIATDTEILDVKTQAVKDILAWTIQLNLYFRFWEGIEALAVLWLPKSGNFERVPIAVLDDGKMLEVIKAYRECRTLPADWLLAEAPEAPSLELVIYSQSVGELVTNAKAILATVKTQIAHYRAENYSEDNLAEAKRDKAELNAAAKKLNDRRLELERQFMRPFAEFKDLIGAACTEIKTASGLIDDVVRQVEDRTKAEKRKLLEESWAALDCQLFPLGRIWQDKWLNKGAKNKDSVAEMAERITKAKADLAVLDRIGEPEAKALYLDTLDLEGALAAADRIKANRERLEESMRADLARRSEREAKEALWQAEQAAKAPEVPGTVSDAAPVPIFKAEEELPVVLDLGIRKVEPEEILERRMKVRATLAQLIALSRWMNENGIDFEKIEGGSF